MAGNPNIAEYGKKTRFKAGSEQVETARAGGVASQEAQRANREFDNVLKAILNTQAPEKIANKLKDAGIKDNRFYAALGMAMVNKALKGDVSAFNSIRDTIGEKPTDKVELENRIDIDEKVKEIEEYMNGK